MRYKILFLCLVSALVMGCVKQYEKHHITLNDSSGIDTQFFPTEKRLKIGDKPYMLFFFGTDCGVCKAAIPDLNTLEKEYGKEVQFIGILGPSKGFDKDIELLKEHNITFKTTSDKVSVDYFSKAVGGVMGVPVIYFFDKDGKMRSKFIGLTPKSVLEGAIRSLL